MVVRRALFGQIARAVYDTHVARSRLHPLFVFGLFAVLCNAAIAFAVGRSQSATVTAAACADLLITLPAVYYVLVVRTGAQPPTTVVPVLLGGLLRVSHLVSFSEGPRIITAVGCETGIAWFLIRRGRNSLAARILMSELSIFASALAVWRVNPRAGRPALEGTRHA